MSRRRTVIVTDQNGVPKIRKALTAKRLSGLVQIAAHAGQFIALSRKDSAMRSALTWLEREVELSASLRKRMTLDAEVRS